MERDRCEMSTIHKKEKATICVLWTRNRPTLGIEIKHRHLCGSHANIMANGAGAQDEWRERTLAECAAQGSGS
jgi:hypothetical protein